MTGVLLRGGNVDTDIQRDDDLKTQGHGRKGGSVTRLTESNLTG